MTEGNEDSAHVIDIGNDNDIRDDDISDNMDMDMGSLSSSKHSSRTSIADTGGNEGINYELVSIISIDNKDYSVSGKVLGMHGHDDLDDIGPGLNSDNSGGEDVGGDFDSDTFDRRDNHAESDLLEYTDATGTASDARSSKGHAASRRKRSVKANLSTHADSGGGSGSGSGSGSTVARGLTRKRTITTPRARPAKKPTAAAGASSGEGDAENSTAPSNPSKRKSKHEREEGTYGGGKVAWMRDEGECGLLGWE